MRKSPLFVLFITIFIDLLGFGLIIPILPILAMQMGATGWQIGLLAASFSLMQFMFAPFWGGLSDRVGRKPVILVSVFTSAISYLAFSLSGTLSLLLFSRIMAGIGSANISAAQAYISDVTDVKDRAKSFGIIGAAFGLGFIFGPPLGGYLKANFGHGSVGLVASAFCVFNLVIAYFFLPESIRKKNRAARFLVNPFKDLHFALGREVVRELMVLNFIFIMAFSMMQISAALLWEQHYDLTEEHVGYMFAFIGVCSAIIQGTMVGRMTKVFGENNLLRYGNLLMCIGLVSMPFVHKEYFIPLELVSIVLIAIANGAVAPAASSLLSQQALPGEQGRILGISQSFGSLGRVAGPFLGGTLYGWDYHLPYIAGGALMVFCYFLATLLVQRKLKTAI